MKSAAQLLLGKTDQEIWHRGEVYADKGNVIIETHNDNEIGASVKGTQNYRVVIKFTPTGIKYNCDCPYVKKVGYICKHIIASAIVWDEKRGIPRPQAALIKALTIPPPKLSRKDINNFFNNPLFADLEHLRIFPDETALGGKGRKHSQLPKAPDIGISDRQALTLSGIKKGFTQIKSWSKRKAYDPYFCAGEMVAAFCEILRIVITRLNTTPPAIVCDILLEAQKFNSILVVELIDDSQGLREFSEAHLDEIYNCLKEHLGNEQPENKINSKLLEYEKRRGEYY